MDLIRLIKIMNLTTSSNDQECLNAIRMANRLIAENNFTWDELISIDDDVQESPKNAVYDIEEMLVFIYSNMNLWKNFDSLFVDNILMKHQTKKYITPNQINGLIRIYEKFKKLKSS